ncbi:hypothetical protein FRC06_002614 [Ceratobasidium sp. 370]|nr:hypothetical protein FRC06_002614 [Ceratobasidium sp. 370]
MLVPEEFYATSLPALIAGYSEAPFLLHSGGTGFPTKFGHENMAHSHYDIAHPGHARLPLLSQNQAAVQDDSAEQSTIFDQVPRRSETHHSDPSEILPTPLSVWRRPNTLVSRPVSPCPHGTYLAPDYNGQMVDYIISQQKQLLSLVYFKPLHQQLACIRNFMSQRLQTSQATRLAMFLGGNILQSILDGTREEKFPIYLSWLHRFDGQLRLTSERSIPSAESQDRLTGALEVNLLKLRLSKSPNVYHLLRDSVPVFLRLALAVMMQQPTSRPSPSISLAHILKSTHYELGHFIMLDSLCSMLYALPQVIDYDTSVAPLRFDLHPVEWIHGCPATLQVTLIDINSLFHRKQAGQEPDWQPIERHLKSWQPVMLTSGDGESWGAIARLAVHESWRHSLLIYLYMAICVASDDARVQESVRQIFQLTRIIRRSEKSFANAHLLGQYIIEYAHAARSNVPSPERDSEIHLTAGYGSSEDQTFCRYSIIFGMALLRMANPSDGATMSIQDGLHFQSLFEQGVYHGGVM